MKMKETVIQFGTGNFLRGFADDFIHRMNEQDLYDGKIVIVQPTRGGKTELLNSQNGRYNLFLRGIENDKEVCEHILIESVSRGVDPYSNYEEYLRLAENPDMRFIISNTTEAGIVFDESCLFADTPALSFPGKLTQLLYHRFEMNLNGFVILPCELIDNNADELKKCVLKYARLWELGDEFINWIETENSFCNTLVDRIVTGYPTAEADELFKQIGYEDKLLDTAEVFHLWVIEGDFENEFPLTKAGVNVIWTNDVKPYKKMKVRILNGAHTSLVFPSLLCGIETVKESLDDELLKEFLNICIYGYILPVLGETAENKAFAAAVLERFRNPYIKHRWQSISLNSVSKYTARVLPTVLDYINANGKLPKPLVFSLACLIEYYKNNDVSDSKYVTDFIKGNTAEAILANTSLWSKDLSCMTELVSECLEKIRTLGIREALKWAMS
ncbi:MAG: tagaturonate reductase [Clostridia bacterium]|nr:tagaturonate reductase [Clostridia bacterium]